jgi:hypothetical protein
MQIRDGAGNLLGVVGNPLYVADEGGETFIGAYQAELIATVNATAQTANTGGFFWGFNPATSGKIVRIERMGIQIGHTTYVLAGGLPTAPRLTFTKFTYTGTPSGAVVAANGAASTQGKFDTNYATPVFDWRSAITGATCVYGHAIFSSLAPAQVVSGTVVAPASYSGVVNDNEYQPRETEYEHVIRPGEGLVFFQPEAGTTGDTRKVTARIFWEEVTVP